MVSDYLQAECTLGHTLGPHPCQQIQGDPKKHQVGMWRLILDHSSPEGASINDGISRDLSSVKYPYFDQAARLIVMKDNRHAEVLM